MTTIQSNTAYSIGQGYFVSCNGTPVHSQTANGVYFRIWAQGAYHAELTIAGVGWSANYSPFHQARYYHGGNVIDEIVNAG